MTKLTIERMVIMNSKFIKDTAERSVMAFLSGWLGSAMANGLDFDSLTNTDNLKVGVTALALTIAAALGLKKVGPNKDSASVV
jgi:hypothetical protein